MFLPGLTITSQTFGGWWVISRVPVIKNSDSSGRQMALAGAVLTPQCSGTLLPASRQVDLKPWLFPALHKHLCSSTSWGHFRFYFWLYKYKRMSSVFFYHVSVAQRTSKTLFFFSAHTLVNSSNSQACRSLVSVTTGEGNISRRAVWFVTATFVLFNYPPHLTYGFDEFVSPECLFPPFILCPKPQMQHGWLK